MHEAQCCPKTWKFIPAKTAEIALFGKISGCGAPRKRGDYWNFWLSPCPLIARSSAIRAIDATREAQPPLLSGRCLGHGALKMELSGPTIVTQTRELPAAHTG